MKAHNPLLTGSVYGSWTIIEDSDVTNHRSTALVQCECGLIARRRVNRLLSVESKEEFLSWARRLVQFQDQDK